MAFKVQQTQEELDKEMPELPNPSILKPFPIKVRMVLQNKLRVVKMLQIADILFVLTFDTLEV